MCISGQLRKSSVKMNYSCSCEVRVCCLHYLSRDQCAPTLNLILYAFPFIRVLQKRTSARKQTTDLDSKFIGNHPNPVKFTMLIHILFTLARYCNIEPVRPRCKHSKIHPFMNFNESTFGEEVKTWQIPVHILGHEALKNEALTGSFYSYISL